MIRAEVQEEAEFILREGGEIPEVAFWNAYLYLTQAPDGPRLDLTEKEIFCLKEAVINRYLKIIERDLTITNIEKSFYRGPQRARINWQRLKRFLEKEGLPWVPFLGKVYRTLRAFLEVLPLNHPLYPEALDFWKELEEERHEGAGGFALCYRRQS